MKAVRLETLGERPVLPCWTRIEQLRHQQVHVARQMKSQLLIQAELRMRLDLTPALERACHRGRAVHRPLRSTWTGLDGLPPRGDAILLSLVDLLTAPDQTEHHAPARNALGDPNEEPGSLSADSTGILCLAATISRL